MLDLVYDKVSSCAKRVDGNATERRTALAIGAGSLFAAFSTSSIGQTASASQPASNKPPSVPRCLIAYYSGFSGAFSTAEIDDALIAGIRALAVHRTGVEGQSAKEQVDRQISALRDLRSGLEK